MSNPPVIQLAARRMNPPPAMPKPVPNDREAKTIALCVKYCQLLAAMDVGFEVDPTDEQIHANRGNHLPRATRILPKLVGLSPHMVTGAAPLSAGELAAKAAVAQALYGFRSGEELEPAEALFMRIFAGEVAGYLAAQAEQAAEARRVARSV
ncbi:hypothetical protein [Bradyrhizobium genomosp. III]|uniref:hypothetical protein n=1 Tax=Bradyrhizobium genomosp. III TaxID=2683271 RepID=UPI0012F50216|nr:hypothetical protein [Bradyrhizobium sp. CCBAU 15544]